MSVTLETILLKLKAEEAALRHRGIRHLSVFGSLARGEDGPGSDVDLAVDIEQERSFSLIRMEDTRLLLEDLLGRHVDLGEAESFRPQLRSAFERERIQVF
jgi:predicted nucleotidyltransferase